MNDAEEAVCDIILKERYLFGVCWSQSQIVQAVWGHVPNSIEEPGVSDCFHTQLPRQEMRHRYFFLMLTASTITLASQPNFGNFTPALSYSYAWDSKI